ncbi:MAG: hypothetical protein JKY95_09925 [Planctomycetaceae bacterium]|nr:hypothetical protein [Planctomycetaceae bacterium]
MAVVAAGPISLPLENLKKTLAASAAFQAAVGAANATEAESSIYRFWIPGPTLNKAMIRSTGEEEADRVTIDSWKRLGPLRVVIELETPSEYQNGYEDAGTWFTNTIGAIQSEMQAMAVGNPGLYLNIVLDPKNWTGC